MLWLLVLGVANAFVTYPTLTGIEVTDPSVCKSHYFPFDGNVCKYYQCEESDEYASGWVAFERTCMKPLNFDPETCSCQWPTMIKGIPDWTCHDAIPAAQSLEPCDARGSIDQCCQPCQSYWPIADCTQGFGRPYTKINDTHYSYCDVIHICPKDTEFDLDNCRCKDPEPWQTFTYAFPIFPNGDPLLDVEGSSILDAGDCMVNPGGQPGIACSGTGTPASLALLQKQWLGRAWGIGFAVDGAAEGILVSNGNDEVEATIQFEREGDEIVATFRGDQGNIELRVPYIEGQGLIRYYAFMNNEGYIQFYNGDASNPAKVAPPFTWVLEGTRCSLNIGQSMGRYSDIMVNYFSPSNQAAIDWVFGGAPPQPYDN